MNALMLQDVSLQLVEEGTVAVDGEPRVHLHVGLQEFFF